MSEVLTFILTSYNRPRLVERALGSLIDQQDPRWRCLVADDGSTEQTRAVLARFAATRKKQIRVAQYQTSDDERLLTSRYAVLINAALDKLQEEGYRGIVGYMCDNVELAPELVGTVLDWFAESADRLSGYVHMSRDIWQRNGRSPDGVLQIGPASLYGHWDLLPPRPLTFSESCAGLLDHSQVYHRFPVEARWSERAAHVKVGDGVFFDRLIKETGALAPITPAVLAVEHLIK